MGTWQEEGRDGDIVAGVLQKKALQDRECLIVLRKESQKNLWPLVFVRFTGVPVGSDSTVYSVEL